jgi:hypothetical protein
VFAYLFYFCVLLLQHLQEVFPLFLHHPL